MQAPAARIIETEITFWCGTVYHLAADARDLAAQRKRAQPPPAVTLGVQQADLNTDIACCCEHEHAAVCGGSDDELEAGYAKNVTLKH